MILRKLFIIALVLLWAGSAFGDTYISNADIDDEDMAVITDWTDTDAGTGDSTQATFDSKSCMKLDTGATGAGGNNSERFQDIGSFGTRTVLSMNLYFDAIGTIANEDHFIFNAYSGVTRLLCKFGTDGLFIWDGSSWNEIGTNLVVQDSWQEWTFDVNWTAKTVNVYLDNVLKVSGTDCSYDVAGFEGLITIGQYGYANANRITYIDWFKAGSDLITTSSESSEPASYTAGLSNAMSFTL